MNSLNNLRGFAILLVVLMHAEALLGPLVRSEAVDVLVILLRNCTLLFVALAGYLFVLMSERSFDYPAFLRDKARNVLLPYAVTSAPALFITLWAKNTHPWIDMGWFHTALNPLEQAGFLLLTGAHLGPLWFIPMIALYYLASPAFVFLLRRGWLPGAFVIALAGGIWAGRPELNDNAFHAAVFFLPAWLLGMLLAQRPGIYECLQRRSLPLLAGLCGLLLGVTFLSGLKEIPHGADLPFKLAMCLALFAVFRAHANVKNRWLDMLARLSFFIFFLHGYFISIFGIAFKQAGPMVAALPLLSVFFLFAISTAATVAAFAVGKMLLGRRTKYLLGA